MNRRTFLQVAGASVLPTGVLDRGDATASDVLRLQSVGLEDGDLIDPYLDEHFVDGRNVRIPEGTYRWHGSGLNATADAALVGEGNVVFETSDEETIDERVHATEGTVLLKNITQRGTVQKGDKGITAWAQEGARVVIENVNRPDGAVDEVSAIGFFVPPIHAGEIHFRNCRVENFPNNGLYASAPGKREQGKVVVEGGLYRNNNVAGVRVGSDGSVVRNVTIVNDIGLTDVVGPKGGRNARGLWIRTGGDDVLLENVDVTFTGAADGASIPLAINPRNGHSSGTVRNFRIWNATDNVPVQVNDRVAGSWSGSGLQLSGPGNLSSESPADQWVSCVADGETECAAPVRNAQLAENDLVQIRGVDAGGNGFLSQNADDDVYHEDVNGDGKVNVLDVQTLYANRNDERMDDPLLFDFNEDTNVDILDVQRLYREIS